MQRHIEREVRVSARQQLQAMSSLGDSDDYTLDRKSEEYLSELISDSLDEAIEEREQEARTYRAIARSRCTKPQAAIIIALCSLLSAGLGAGVTLAIHFSGG